MTSLTKKISSNKFSLFLRKAFNFRPPKIILPDFSNDVSISDAFLWRTDNGFETIFKYTDLLRLFYEDENSTIKIPFFDKSNNFLREVKLKINNTSDKLIINKSFLNGLQSYGSFFIFHEKLKKHSQRNKSKTIIRNSCYTGYSRHNKNPSFVHGNTPAIAKEIEGSNYYFNFSQWNGFQKNTYVLQNNFESFDYTELCFVNPMKKILNIKLNNQKFRIKEHNSLIVKVGKVNFCKIQSNCSFIRPIIFNYRKKFYDVYHG